LIGTFFIWKKCWKKKIKPLTDPIEEKFADYIVMTMIFIDLLQVIGMGPDLLPFLFGVNTIPNLISANFSSIANFTGTFFWVSVYVTLFVVLVWVYLMIVIFFRLDQKTDLYFFKFSDYLGLSLMPIVCDALFLPVICVLFFVFDCRNGISSSISDSYMTQDCYTFCWKGTHLAFAILSAVALVVYLPLSIFCRPLWQELESEVNIKTSSIYTMFKGVLQVGLVILNRSVKGYNQSLHGVIIIFVLILFWFFLRTNKPYNYGRMNLWKQASILIGCWSTVVGSGYWFVLKISYVWTILYFSGVTIIIVLGFFIQNKKYPSLLYSEKGIDISVLLKFGLTVNINLNKTSLSKISTLKFSHKKYKIAPENLEDPKSLKRFNEKQEKEEVKNLD
jgi:hypothetical protein